MAQRDISFSGYAQVFKKLLYDPHMYACVSIRQCHRNHVVRHCPVLVQIVESRLEGNCQITS